MGTRLRITPNSVHRHFETLLDASARAALVNDTEGVKAIRDVYVTACGILGPNFLIHENPSVFDTH